MSLMSLRASRVSLSLSVCGILHLFPIDVAILLAVNHLNFQSICEEFKSIPQAKFKLKQQIVSYSMRQHHYIIRQCLCKSQLFIGEMISSQNQFNHCYQNRFVQSYILFTKIISGLNYELWINVSHFIAFFLTMSPDGMFLPESQNKCTKISVSCEFDGL